MVSDDEVGVPDDFDLATNESLGLSIVLALVESELDGRISYTRADRAPEAGVGHDEVSATRGTVVTVVVPLSTAGADDSRI